ncbi:MAG TPA: glycosyltransferase family 2 protein [Bacteroidia bacterium]|nr:glycosyltransferase family 2 protein [Bacteroidia bacterium]
MQISVIIPVYNAEKYIRKSVESALQFEEVKEVILIEDGSPDNSLSTCVDLCKEFSKVKLFRHPDGKNHGAGASRNLGLKNASYPFISFLDADDYFLPNRFDTDKEIFKRHTDADGVYNAIGMHFYSEESRKYFIKPLTTVNCKCSPDNLFTGLVGMIHDFGHFHLDGFTLKRSALLRINSLFNPQLRLHQDTEFLIRASWYINLYAGELTIPVANRGVHSDNRITKVFAYNENYYYNRSLLWTSLYDWGRKENLPAEKFRYIKRMYMSFKITTLKGIVKWVFIVKSILFDKELLINNQYYSQYSSKLFKSLLLKKYFEKLRYYFLRLSEIFHNKIK